MRAAVLHGARDLRIEERDDPTPGPGEVELRIGAGGICGSDLHYYQDGGFGTVRVREPMILGHEIAGTVARLGAGVAGLSVGQTVAVNPSQPCGRCRYCLEGKPQHCLDMRFYGSAMRTPHVQGGFSERLVCRAEQAVPLPAGVSLGEAAFAEPLAVCLHAAGQAGALLGARVLVTGAGPIGMLAMLVARAAGAREIVATDLLAAPLALAARIVADRTVNVGTEPEGLAPFRGDKGHFDVVIEASGAAPALAVAIEVARPGATVVQLGIGGGQTPVPLNTVVAKEITLRGSFRFHPEFAVAAEMIAGRRIDVRPLLTETVPLAEAVRGFELASDRGRAMKVQLGF